MSQAQPVAANVFVAPPRMTAAATTTAKESGAFVSPVIDFALMGGASILTYLLFRLFHSGEREAWIIALGAQLTWICNWPHFAATSLRLYKSQTALRQFPLTALLTPILMGLGVAASFTWPVLFAPYFLKLYAIWSPYHFSGQTVGISVVYARRTGTVLSQWERRMLGFFVFSTFLYPSIRAEETLSGFQEGGITYPSFGVNHHLVQFALAWMVFCSVAWIGILAVKSYQQKKLVHPLFILPALTQFIWFVPGAESAGFQEFVPFFHSLQYLVIAWALQLRERFDATGATPGKKFVTVESARWGAMIFVVGAFLFYGLPRLVAFTGVSLILAISLVQAGVQLHHFFVDGIIWRLRNKSVASPLAVRIHDLIGH